MAEKTLEAHLYDCLKVGNTKKALYIVGLLKDNVNKLYRGSSPLLWAKKFGCEEVIQALEQKGALEIGPTDKEAQEMGRALLNMVGGYANLKDMYDLVDRGADLDVRGFNKVTILMECIDSKMGRGPFVKKLFEADVDVNAQDSYGHSALTRAIIKGGYFYIDDLIERGADVNVRDDMERSLLHFAAEYNTPQTIEKLIAFGLDINGKDKKGKTPLMYALWNNNWDAARALIKLGADVNLQDENGTTALMVASVRGENLMIGPLIEAGADVNIKNNNGFTAMSITEDENIRKVIMVAIGKKHQKDSENIVLNKNDMEFLFRRK